MPPPPRPGLRLTPAAWLHVTTFGLGVLLLFLGFAPWAKPDIAGAEGISAYEGGGGLSSALSFVVGGVSLFAVLPGGTGRAGPLPPVLALALALNFLFSVFAIPDGVELAAGGIISMLFNVILTATASIAYYLDVRRPRPSYPSYPYPAAYPPPGPVPPHHP
jgi:hypothetical protein